MYSVSLEFLNQTLIQFNSDIGTLYPRLSPSFKICFDVGTRLIESIQPSRWELKKNYFILTTAKGSEKREIKLKELQEESIYFLLNSPDAYQERPQTIYEYTMRRFYKGREFYIGEKRSYTHIFRHRIAKNMKAEGKNDKTIQKYLGEKTIISAQQYIYSEIYTNLPY
jgi:integrase